METLHVGPCKCGGYGIVFNEETEAALGRCHDSITGSGSKIIYCDRCKVDTETCSKLFYPEGGEQWITGDACPNCGSELFEAPTRDDIP